jgi:protein TonB
METGNRLSGCLLDHKDEESRRARRLRRRTLLLAILIQLLMLTLLVLRPLLGAPAGEIMLARMVPLPPYRGQPDSHSPPERSPAPQRPRHGDVTVSPVLFFPRERPPVPHGGAESDAAPDIGPSTGAPPGWGPGDPNGLIPLTGPSGWRPAPPAPPREKEASPQKRPVVASEIQEAKLITRVEPVYPVLAKQIRLEGTVLIRAVIARDGSVQSVEVLSGHPWLAQAARDAILRWRYRPTLLRGEPIEVETLITVIFRMR